MKIRLKDRKQITEFSKKLEVLYEIFNWTWWDSEEPPTAEKIEEHITNLIKGMKKSTDSVSCGGITIEKEDEGYYRIEWKLKESIWLDLK